MSKIYNKYLELKRENSDKLYLFHSGKFYIFIADDVDTINQYVVLRRTKFTNNISKCGFPDNSFSDYMRVFHNHNLDIDVIESSLIEISENSDNINKMVDKYVKIEKCLKDIDINSISPLQSMDILNCILRCFND